MGPNIYIGDKLLLSYKLPLKLMNIWGIFQSTGRIFWPVTYSITFFALIALYKIVRDKSKMILIFGICLLFQNLEKTNFLSGLMYTFSNIDDMQSADTLLNPIWDEILVKDCEVSLLFCGNPNLTIPFMIKGTENNFKLNTSYLARLPHEKIMKLDQKKYSNILDGKIDDRIYVIMNDEYKQQIYNYVDSSLYDILDIDGYTILIKKGMVNLDNYVNIENSNP